MFWTILGIVLPITMAIYCGALAVKNIAKLFGR